MKTTPKISIVVPIYQVECYLEACLDSILGQTIKELELVLVDDGSPDRSGEIADRYASAHSNVIVIHQSNTGLGPARNRGMAAATGEYVGFVDADDWVESCMYEKLYAQAAGQNADIVISGHRVVSNGLVTARKVHPMAGCVLSGREEIHALRKHLFGPGTGESYSSAFPTSVCMSIYRREFLCRYSLKFRNIMSEDLFFNLDAYKYADSIRITDQTDYCYRRDGQSSITASFSDKTIKKYTACLETLMAQAQQESDTYVLRVQRKAVDYCRMYVRSVGMSSLGHREKKRLIGAFAETEALGRLWRSCPARSIPPQQWLLHSMLLHRRYGCALALLRIRDWLRMASQLRNRCPADRKISRD